MRPVRTVQCHFNALFDLVVGILGLFLGPEAVATGQDFDSLPRSSICAEERFERFHQGIHTDQQSLLVGSIVEISRGNVGPDYVGTYGIQGDLFFGQVFAK